MIKATSVLFSVYMKNRSGWAGKRMCWTRAWFREALAWIGKVSILNRLGRMYMDMLKERENEKEERKGGEKAHTKGVSIG